MAMNCNSGDGWRACKEDVEAKGCLIHAQRMVLVVQEGSKMLPPVNLLTWLRKPGEHLKLRYLRWGRMQAPQGGTPSLHHVMYTINFWITHPHYSPVPGRETSNLTYLGLMVFFTFRPTTHLVEVQRVQQVIQFPVLLILVQHGIVLYKAVQGQLAFIIHVNLLRLRRTTAGHAKGGGGAKTGCRITRAGETNMLWGRNCGHVQWGSCKCACCWVWPEKSKEHKY
eukprot:1147865-Pelagomonas_calceolata.AAC.3